MQYSQTCKTCVTEFSYERLRPQGRPRLYCSVACGRVQQRANPGNRTLHVRNCAVCATEFRTPNARTKCCGQACGGILGKRLGDLARKANALKRNARTCKQCGVAFQRMRGAPGIFCTKACTASSRRLYANRSEAKAAARKRARERRSQPHGDRGTTIFTGEPLIAGKPQQ
jgi:hypothetical protein